MKTVIAFSVASLIVAISTASAQAPEATGSGFPGDFGRPFNGLPLPDGPLPPRPPMPPNARSPTMALALEAAEATVAACKGYEVSVSIIDAAGTPKLYYVADGTAGFHAYTGFRKAYTALVFGKPTSEVTVLAKKGDPAVAAKIAADKNMLSFAGGLPIMAGGTIIGAIGVSGAEPSAKDEECGVAGLNKIRDRLK